MYMKKIFANYSEMPKLPKNPISSKTRYLCLLYFLKDQHFFAILKVNDIQAECVIYDKSF